MYKGGVRLPNQTPLIMQGCLSGKWYVVTKYKQLGGDKVQSLEKFDVTDRILEIVTEAGEETAKLRQELADQERINEELEQENAILKHQTKPDKITFNPQFRENERKEKTG
jgi:hypothetical protein